MPALQNISVVDRTPVTPVAHVFTPRDVTDGTGLVVNGAGVPLGEERLTISCKKSGKKFRGKLTLTVPTMVTETINGVATPRLVRTAYATLDLTFDDTSTTQERNNLVGMLADSLGTGKVLTQKAFVDLEGIYGS